MGKERRRAERLDANLFAEIETVSGTRLGRAVVTDVSLSGLAVESEADLPINGDVVCYIEVPVQLKARVVRSIGNTMVRRYGLHFEHQSFFDKLFFRRLLKGTRRTRKIGG
jgi:hypothetical protein